MLLTALPLDLIHNLFLVLDDRRTLAAFFSTNRHFYGVFETHPNSILSQVVCNEIGIDIRVLPYAWANIKSRYMVIPKKSMETELEIVSTDSSILSLTSKIFKLMKESHTIVRRFSKHYSIRYKEGRILRDTLTTEESRRFQIAAYLFLHYQTIWVSFQYTLKFSDGIEFAEIKAGEDPVRDTKTMDACRTFLWRLPTEELLWIQEFQNFLLQDIEEVLLYIKNHPTLFALLGMQARYSVNLSMDAWRHLLLSTPPSVGGWYNTLISKAYPPTHLHRKELWLTDALSRVLQERGFQTQVKHEIILKSKGIVISACQKCQRSARRKFFNKTNLENFSPYWTCSYFPGQLSHNAVETGRALNRIHSPAARSEDATQRERLVIIGEVMEHAEKQAASSLENRGASVDDGLVVSGDEDESDHAKAKSLPAKGDYKWSPDDALCLPCFITIFKDLYYAWWLDERQTDRVEAHTFAEGPCLLGKDCYDQGDEDHATRLEHCFPQPKDVVL